MSIWIPLGEIYVTLNQLSWVSEGECMGRGLEFWNSQICTPRQVLAPSLMEKEFYCTKFNF